MKMKPEKKQMSNESTIKFCKNKKCHKILPAGYKHKYCEACRNQHAKTTKNILKGVGACAATAASVAILAASGGKINLKR